MPKHTPVFTALLIFFVFTFFSCQRGVKENPLARVDGNYLYESDLPRFLTEDIQGKDSITLVKSYVEKWIKEQLILEKAELNIEQEETLEKQIDDYRKSILIYTYEQKMLKQKLDTTVDESAKKAYFDENTEKFKLTRPVVRALYIKLPKTAPNTERVEAWYTSSDAEDIQELENYCFQYADRYDFFEDNWVYFDEIATNVPTSFSDPERFLRVSNAIEASDSLHHYYVHIREKKYKGETMPFSLIENDIESILLNKKKLQFLKELETNIFLDGKQKNKFEIYTK